MNLGNWASPCVLEGGREEKERKDKGGYEITHPRANKLKPNSLINI